MKEKVNKKCRNCLKDIFYYHKRRKTTYRGLCKICKRTKREGRVQAVRKIKIK